MQQLDRAVVWILSTNKGIAGVGVEVLWCVYAVQQFR